MNYNQPQKLLPILFLVAVTVTYILAGAHPDTLQAAASWQTSSLPTPTPLPPNIRLSTKSVVPNTATIGDVLTYTVVVDKRGGPNQHATMMIDNLRSEVVFTGTLTATGPVSQFLYSAWQHAIGWVAILPDGPVTTILTWQVEITGVPPGGILTNSALIASDNHWVTREAAVVIHTPTASVTPTPTDTSTPNDTSTPTNTPTNTPLPTATAKPTSPDTSPAGTAQNSDDNSPPPATPTPTLTATPTGTSASTATSTVSATPQIISAATTNTPSPTAIPTTASPVPTQTATPVDSVVLPPTPTPKTSENAGQVRQSDIAAQSLTPTPTPTLPANSPGIRAYGISLASCLLCGIILLLILAIILFIARKRNSNKELETRS